jgi:hypothetical protein
MIRTHCKIYKKQCFDCRNFHGSLEVNCSDNMARS